MRTALLDDLALVLEVEPGLEEAVERWLPLGRRRLPTGGGGQAAPVTGERAVLRVAWAQGDEVERVASGRGLSFGSVRMGPPAERPHAGDRFAVTSAGGLSGAVELGHSRGVIRAPRRSPEPERVAGELHHALTLAGGLLLASVGRALVHAAAVADPRGRAWLLVGDARAGKTTTALNLARRGWQLLSDDQVVLGRPVAAGRGGGAGDCTASGGGRQGRSIGPGVEGWPRLPHLDRGWAEGQPTGVRETVALETGALLRRAPLGGILLPRVQAPLPTVVMGVGQGAALSGLVRQSPWLMASRTLANRVLPLLEAAVRVPAFALSLGLDAYQDAGPVVRALEAEGVAFSAAEDGSGGFSAARRPGEAAPRGAAPAPPVRRALRT